MTLRHWDDLLGGGLAQLSADTEATAGTLALRGASAEVKAARVETSTIRTTAGGAVLLQHGSTTIARFSATDMPTQAGEYYIEPNGRLWGYSVNQGSASAMPFEIELPVRWTDRLTTAATTMSERILSDHFFNQEMSVVTAYYVPEAGLVAHDSNYARIRVYSRRALDGGDQTMMFESFTTTSGLNFTGDWTAWKPVPLGTVGGTHTLPAFYELTWEITIGDGSGVTVPTGRIFLQCIRTAAFPPEE